MFFGAKRLMMISNQKPIEIDAQFKYRCPKCADEHWISMRQARVKNFKIVCDCDTVFKPKRIKTISIVYPSVKNTKSVETTPVVETDEEKKKDLAVKPIRIPLQESIVNKCVKLLVKYGFTNTESKDLIDKAYDAIGVNDVGLLVKKALEILGENK